MKKVMVVIAAVLAFSSVAVPGTTPARAEEAQPKCEVTQGALASSLAALIWGLDAPSSGAESIAKLSGRGIKPAEGWGKPEDCATAQIEAELQKAAAAELKGTEGLEHLVEQARKGALGFDQRKTTSESGLQ